MRGSAAFRTGVAPGGALAGPWTRNPLWASARAVPSLDLRFAENKSLTDATTGANLVTFTRASSGTFVGSDGVLRTAVTNLLLRSEEFGTFWGATNTTVGADTGETVSPTGSSTADKLTSNAGTALKAVFQGFTAVAGSYTFSVYVKKASHDFIQFFYGGTGQGYANFNIATGATGTTVGTSSIVSVGNGWYRCIHSFTASANTSVNIALVDATTSARAATSANTSAVYLWGAQLEQASTVGEYIPTTSAINSAPRFDHNPTTGESLGLLVEEQRTNSFIYSNTFTDASWVQISGTAITRTANAATSPDGTSNATQITASDANLVRQQGAGDAITIRTLSFFAKAGTASTIAVRFFSSTAPNTTTATFDLSTGAATVSDALVTTASIVPFLNGWYRCICCRTDAVAKQTPDFSFGVGTTFIYGAQLEAGAFPTSYIPTTTTALTRSADVASITGTNFSSWYRQDEGTAAILNWRPSSVATTMAALGFGADPLNNADWIAIVRSTESGGRVRLDAKLNNIRFADNIGRNTAATPISLAAGLSSAPLSLLAGGLAGSGTISASALPNASQLTIGRSSESGVATMCGTIARITYWPVRLGNNVLQQITQ